jgi:UDP-N-acetylmuramoyl-tripeptide--D-alanyl-D-alanine ligase
MFLLKAKKIMKNLRKYLFLLQLEEYQNDQFLEWLKHYRIEDLQERKRQLKFTWRIRLTQILASLLSLFSNPVRSITLANSIIAMKFRFLEILLTFSASLKLKFYPRLTKIVITGSYGKTTFKEMLSWVLKGKYEVLTTTSNINTRIGIARIILDHLNKRYHIFVVEAGAYRQGEIRDICRLINPQYGIITIFGWMHLNRFGNFENIKKAKMELVDVIKDKGKLFVPDKDHQFIDFEKTVTDIARSLGLTEIQIKSRLVSFSNPEHRLSISKLNSQVTLLDDAYNSNPHSFSRAITELAKYPRTQKIIVTPGMIDLGEEQFEFNEVAAKEAAEVVDLFVIIGHTNKEALAQGIRDSGKKINVVYLTKDEDLFSNLTTHLRPPTVILIENDLPDNYF